MEQVLLQKAGEYEKKSEDIRMEKRPSFHLSARIGWLNDPNGFCCYKGDFHLFYQYYPYDTSWGLMYWGHAVSKDLLHWDYLPPALAPSKEYDNSGCFSGTSIELDDKRHLLMYTGVEKGEDEKGQSYERQTQCIAIGDGVHYEKYEKNPVIDRKLLPEGASPIDFRDPKIWRDQDGSYLCLVGNRPADKSGQLLLYKSSDALCWDFVKVFAKNENRYGKMWECPDFFELDKAGVLLVSPQDMSPKDLEFHNGNGTLCIVGDYDRQSYTFCEKYHQAIDYGIDFYAPQTTLSPDGRRIMIGWMQNWDTVAYKSDEQWFGQMSIPRELSVVDNRLIQKPIEEIKQLRTNERIYENVDLKDKLSLEGVKGRCLDLEIEVFSRDIQNAYKSFEIRFAEDKSHHISLTYDREAEILEIDRSYGGSTKDVVHRRSCYVKEQQGRLDLRIIMDKYSAEIFINGGEKVMSLTYYTDLNADGITFSAQGQASFHLRKYDLVMNR